MPFTQGLLREELGRVWATSHTEPALPEGRGSQVPADVLLPVLSS